MLGDFCSCVADSPSALGEAWCVSGGQSCEGTWRRCWGSWPQDSPGRVTACSREPQWEGSLCSILAVLEPSPLEWDRDGALWWLVWQAWAQTLNHAVLPGLLRGLCPPSQAALSPVCVGPVGVACFLVISQSKWGRAEWPTL